MRTTIRLDDRLFAEIKQLAAETGRTVSAVIADAVRETLARRQSDAREKRVTLPVHGTGGLQPGVDLENSASVWDLTESRQGSA
jgi:hypothetical protein